MLLMATRRWGLLQMTTLLDGSVIVHRSFGTFNGSRTRVINWAVKHNRLPLLIGVGIWITDVKEKR